MTNIIIINHFKYWSLTIYDMAQLAIFNITDTIPLVDPYINNTISLTINSLWFTIKLRSPMSDIHQLDFWRWPSYAQLAMYLQYQRQLQWIITYYWHFSCFSVFMIFQYKTDPFNQTSTTNETNQTRGDSSPALYVCNDTLKTFLSQQLSDQPVVVVFLDNITLVSWP